MTTRQEISQWFDQALSKGATHMIVVVDTFDYENYPVHVMPDQDVHKIVGDYAAGRHSMQRIMEVYKMSEDRDEQLALDRCFWTA